MFGRAMESLGFIFRFPAEQLPQPTHGKSARPPAFAFPGAHMADIFPRTGWMEFPWFPDMFYP